MSLHGIERADLDGFAVEKVIIKKRMPVASSKVNGSMILESPTSGLKDQRFVPTLSSLSELYWPSGAVTSRLAPMMKSGL